LNEQTIRELTEAITRQVVKQLGESRQAPRQINLDFAKKLMEAVEKESSRRELRAVVAVCGSDGNMIAVHRMEGAYLASFDVAMKKAYTAAAVQMSTKRLGELAAPGGMFYGVDKADHGRLIIFGGGVPLYYNGVMVGALGVSGGTSEEDHQLAEYGKNVAEGMFYGRI